MKHPVTKIRNVILTGENSSHPLLADLSENLGFGCTLLHHRDYWLGGSID